MKESLVLRISTELINFSMPSVATIFTGSDDEGTHIYIAEGGSIQCRDTIGFAAIGAGRWHANSQFMFAQHSRFTPAPETLLLTYAAKKRSEVAPGVGKETDMFIVGRKLGSYARIDVSTLNDLEKMYKARVAREKRASEKANKEVIAYVENFIKRAPAEEQEVSPNDSGGNTPTDEK
ncbi:MAG TPA: hypothetical protein VGK22_11980 [Candidatus Angelobacter sp.]|jgi:hypothetical protein